MVFLSPRRGYTRQNVWVTQTWSTVTSIAPSISSTSVPSQTLENISANITPPFPESAKIGIGIGAGALAMTCIAVGLWLWSISGIRDRGREPAKQTGLAVQIRSPVSAVFPVIPNTPQEMYGHFQLNEQELSGVAELAGLPSGSDKEAFF